ncbi:MAG: hypothetical protein Q7R95_07305 [bacterium]|nr:hypothetical protein [bacterium]
MNTRRQFIKKSLITLGVISSFAPILLKNQKQPLYLVKAKVIDSFWYKDVEFKYYGKKQCKIGDIITLKEQVDKNIEWFSKNPYISIFEVTEHKQMGYYETKNIS